MLRFSINYISWHYSTAIKELLINIRNFIWFIYHFFSIPVLLSTLFYPWRGMGEAYGSVNIFRIAETLSSLLVNFLMRIVGFFARIFLIIIGVLMLILAFCGGAVVFVGWIFLPLIIFVIFISGLRLIFN